MAKTGQKATPFIEGTAHELDGNVVCSICNRMQPDDLVHFLIECPLTMSRDCFI